MGEFQRDFALMSGMKLAFLDELGLGDDLEPAHSPLCQAMQACAEGRALCARSRHALLAKAEEKPCEMTCDAGLCESVVPLNIGGIRAGYFVFGGIRAIPVDPHAIHKAAHLLRKNGIVLEEEQIEQALRDTPEISEPTLHAYQRVVLLFARQIALQLTDQLGEPDASMPPMVLKACGYIRASAMVDDIDLNAVARHCGLSVGHLSRLFHHSTGLTFREYLAQVRVEHARELLLRTGRNISEVAYDSGFQSLSQFHRVFLKAFGVSPGKMRAARRLDFDG